MNKQYRYYEDFEAGQNGITTTRTVTEAHIVNFADITADYSYPHMDEHRMKSSIYGTRVAHGMLGASLATGLLSLRVPHVVGRGVPGAYFYGFESNYRDGIKVGDTVKAHWEIAEKADSPLHEGFGLVKTAFKLINQAEVPVYDGTVSTLVRKESAKDTELRLKPGEPWQIPEYVPDPEKIYCAEDHPVGKGGESEGRTITEYDIVNFAGLISDYNPQYVDAEFARGTAFGERIAHGMLIFTCAFGLWVRDGQDPYHWPESRIAGHLGDNGCFFMPVKIGDTIRTRYKIAATRVSRSKPEMGIVTFAIQVVNQRNEVVQEGNIILMMPSREGLRLQTAA